VRRSRRHGRIETVQVSTTSEATAAARHRIERNEIGGHRLPGQPQAERAQQPGERETGAQPG
jgi:hypothetical protein